MSDINHDYIETYLNGLIPNSCGIIKELEEYAEENHVPIITKDVAELLKTMIRIHKPKRILEIGMAIGYSAIVMGLACEEDFELVTMEKNEVYIALAKENIKKAGFEKNITMIEGDAEDNFAQLTGEFDMIFIDAAKGHYYTFMKETAPMLKKNGIFICDNVLFRGMVAERKLLIRRKITIVKRLQKFLRFITNNEMLQTTILPIGDGVSISYKLSEVCFEEE